ncbi:helix-turn-helix domain-containing protein [Kitasatospora sp. NPDC005856]|uniref:helix-turn-helix domain-containing protein n=1 Tax=Kitasatospora sp. NPDC005856 TaxID=3154566 RepID=UPI0033EA1592
MGRLTSALAERDKEVRTLARWLRALRERSGLTYSQMAHKTAGFARPVSLATLSRADEGRTVPTWPVTEAYTRACGGSVRTAERLWLRADAGRPGRRGSGAKAMPVAPGAAGAGRALPYVTERCELLVAMRRLRLRAGSPSLRELETRAVRGTVSHLPRSTLHGVLAGERDCTERVLVEFVRACGVGPAEEAEWVAALRRTAGTPPPPPDVHRRLAEAHAEIRRLRRALDGHPAREAGPSGVPRRTDRPTGRPVP